MVIEFFGMELAERCIQARLSVAPKSNRVGIHSPLRMHLDTTFRHFLQKEIEPRQV